MHVHVCVVAAIIPEYEIPQEVSAENIGWVGLVDVGKVGDGGQSIRDKVRCPVICYYLESHIQYYYVVSLTAFRISRRIVGNPTLTVCDHSELRS